MMSMTYDRQKQMLNSFVDYVAVGRNTKETIQELEHIGFTNEELYNDFGFGLIDIADAEGEEI